MIRTADRRARLVARHHLGRTARDLHTATRDLVVVHSSDPLTPHLGLWARVPGYRTDDLDRALTAGALWRLHAMRRTLWIAAADEVGHLDAAVGAGIAAKERKRVLGWVADARPDAEPWLDELRRAVLDAVRAAPGVATRQLTAAVPELATRITMGSGKWATEAAIGSRLLMVIAMELDLARGAPTGSWKSSQYGWTVPGPIARPAPAGARAHLVRRYVERFGPVTEVDVTWWTGMTKAQARNALSASGAVEVPLEDGVGWDVPVATPELSSAVALLPGLDPTPMGYKERDWFLGPHEGELFDRNGNIGPSVWVGGRIVGGWAVVGDGEVRIELLETVAPSERAAVEAEAHALQRWLDGTPITPRFRTPLEKRLSS